MTADQGVVFAWGTGKDGELGLTKTRLQVQPCNFVTNVYVGGQVLRF